MLKLCQPLKILIGSIRAGHFTGPLDAAASSYYDLFKKLAHNWEGQVIKKGRTCYKLHFDYFNAVPSGKKPKADIKNLADADILMIVAENEFQYATNKINPMYRQYLDERLEKIRKELPGKTIILLNSDIQHTPELIHQYTLAASPIKKLEWVCENSFPGNIHTLKYWNLLKVPGIHHSFSSKTYDFAYWGSYRADNPERQQILTGLRKKAPEIKAFYLGHLPPFTDAKWTRQFVEAVPKLSEARTTICFGLDWAPSWLTAKYHEAMGMSIIPLVWENYDIDDCLGILPWQRVSSLDELVSKILEVRDKRKWQSQWNAISASYKKHILSENELYDLWEARIVKMI